MAPEDVRRMQQVAYVMAQTVAAYAEIEAMKAINNENLSQKEAEARQRAFREIPEQFGLGHNSVLTTLWEGTR